jgi:hypothetical protein
MRVIPSILVLCISGSASAQSFNIDFGVPGSGPAHDYAAAGQAGFWNSIAAEHTTPNPGPQAVDEFLTDIHGNPTNVRVHQFGGMGTINVNLNQPGDPGDPHTRLLGDALMTYSVPLKSCLYFNNLQNGTYDVLMYTWMPHHPEVNGLSFIDFTPGNELAGGAWPGNHQEGVTYSRFTVNVTNGFMGPHAGLPSGGDPVIGGPLNGMQLRLLCTSAAACGDADGNGIVDDSCAFHRCQSGDCTADPRQFGDVGGAFGACNNDAFTNVHDRTLVLKCFENTTPCAHINLDPGGAFGECEADGFCNIHDANHILESFAGNSACQCGPAPQWPTDAIIAGRTALDVVADDDRVYPGEEVSVRVYAAHPLKRLRSYQLHLEVSGGRQGQLELIDIAIESRRDRAFATAQSFTAFNLDTAQMLAGLDHGDVAVNEGAYLATYTFAVPHDASGTFVIDLMADANAGDQTFLVGNAQDPIMIDDIQPATITVSKRGDRTR